MSEDTSIRHIYSAFIEGGVTDGTNTVFYKDVQSVTTTTKRTNNCWSARFSNWGSRFFWWLMVGVGLWMLFSEIGGGRPTTGGVLKALFVTAGGGGFICIMNWIGNELSTYIEIGTVNGKVTLKFPKTPYRPCSPDIGREIAVIINRRKGITDLDETTDYYHVFYDLNSDEYLNTDESSFEIKGDTLQIFDALGANREIGTTVDLAKVRRVEENIRNYKFPKFFGSIQLSKHGCYEDDVVFEYASGQKSTLYIKHCFTDSRAHPAQELFQSVTDYLDARPA